MKYIKGDIVKLFNEGNYRILIHGANCQQKMGNGVAKALKNKWPQIYDADLNYNPDKKPFERLGDYSYAVVDINNTRKVIINAYTQLYYGNDGKRYVSYDAIDQVFEKLKNYFIKHNITDKKIIIPKIGSKLGGGNWDVIAAIIDNHMKDYDLTVVEFDEN